MNYCTSNIGGGLGNVLFQIATGLSYSLDNNKNFAIFNNSFGHTSHTDNHLYFNNILKNIKRIDNNYENFKPLYEVDFLYSEFEKNSIDNVCLCGYFQSYKYFSNNKDYIRDIFDVGFYPFDTKTCSVHVRRGDYLHRTDVYEQLNMDYYESAMSEIAEDVKFLIFSNDVDWCVENFSKFKNAVIINENDPYKSMSMMASCDHHIIANSTFSWWAAYLSKKEGKVIAPYKWFTRGYLEYISKFSYDDFVKSILPKEWEIL